MSKGEKQTQAQTILRDAFQKIRDMGLAPRFRWGTTPNGDPNSIAAHISDFKGFHELPSNHD